MQDIIQLKGDNIINNKILIFTGIMYTGIYRKMSQTQRGCMTTAASPLQRSYRVLAVLKYKNHLKIGDDNVTAAKLGNIYLKIVYVSFVS